MFVSHLSTTMINMHKNCYERLLQNERTIVSDAGFVQTRAQSILTLILFLLLKYIQAGK